MDKNTGFKVSAQGSSNGITTIRERVAVVGIYSRWIAIFLVSFYLGSGSSLAEESTATVLLYAGKVHLLNQSRQKMPARVGQEIDLEKYPRIEVGKNSRLFLQKGDRLVKIDSPGLYSLKELMVGKSSLLTEAVSFLDQISAPRRFVTRSRARGEVDAESMTKAEYFEYLWQRIVLESNQPTTELYPEELIAAGAWYKQQGHRVRVAYIMERLNSSVPDKNSFYGRLRNESFRGITLVQIDRELSATRQRIEAEAAPLRYMALLVGIDRYDDPSWQRLKTPVADVKALKKVLVDKYHFASQDILLLENATYDQIIGAFNSLKKASTPDASLLIYFAGHGYYPADEEEGYWIPRDAGTPLSQRLFLPTSTILGKVKSIKTKHTLLIADSCFSGSLVRKTRGIEVSSQYYRELSRKKSRQIITSGGLEPVSDQGGGEHSIFANKLIGILSDQRQEPLSASELALNLRKEVKNAWGDQTPEYGRFRSADDESGEFFFVGGGRDHLRSTEPRKRPPLVLSKAVPAARTYSYDKLPKGYCLAPKSFTNLRHCKFKSKRFRNISLEGADLSGVDFKSSDIEDINFKGANLEDTDWRYSRLVKLDFRMARLSHSDWRSTTIGELDFSGSVLIDSDFRYARLDDARFDNADLTDTDMRHTSLGDVSFSGAILANVQSNSNKLFSLSETGDSGRDTGEVVGQTDGSEQVGNKKNSKNRKKSKNKKNRKPDKIASYNSQFNRRQSLFLIGITPISLEETTTLTHPLTVGIYLGGNWLLGLEYGMADRKENAANSYEAVASLDNKGIYLRYFYKKRTNLYLGLNQRTWSAQADVEKSKTVSVNENQTISHIQFGVGEQWLFNSGFTIGTEWVLVKRRITGTATNRDVENGELGTAEADAHLADLEKDLMKDDFMSNDTNPFDFAINLTIGFSF
ncbi:MAG: hypothetical protein GY866_19105 [Proteobacteria bacterium]|nr:hypothetical protein [Pseudomonadota bacterium]